MNSKLAWDPSTVLGMSNTPISSRKFLRWIQYKMGLSWILMYVHLKLQRQLNSNNSMPTPGQHYRRRIIGTESCDMIREGGWILLYFGIYILKKTVLGLETPRMVCTDVPRILSQLASQLVLFCTIRATQWKKETRKAKGMFWNIWHKSR